MIRTLRTQLVAAAMLSLLVVLTVILGVILLGSYRGIVSDADRILDLLAEGGDLSYPAGGFQLGGGGPPPPLPGAGV